MSNHGALVAITGAAQGIGRATSLRLHWHGYRLVLLDRDPALLELADRLDSPATGRPATYLVDLSEEEAVRAAVAEIIEAHGVPDIWVNNAGVGHWGPFDPTVPGSEREEMAVNYHGSVNCIRAILPSWQARGRGHLIQVTSSAALFPGPWMAAYSASKAAIATFIRALRVELRDSGVAITEILPNVVSTRMSQGSNGTNIPRIARIQGELTAEAVAIAIHSAIERRPREIRLPGLLTPFHILSALAPGVIDHLLAWGRRL